MLREVGSRHLNGFEVSLDVSLRRAEHFTIILVWNLGDRIEETEFIGMNDIPEQRAAQIAGFHRHSVYSP